MLPKKIKLADYDWLHGQNIKQFMRTTVIESDNQFRFRTIASGLASIYTEIDVNTKISIITPILITGMGDNYENAWDGSISIDTRQPTHIVFENSDGLDIKQISSGTDELNVLIQKMYAEDKPKNLLYQAFDYVKEKSVVDVNDAETMIKMPIRFFPTVYTNARKVISVCKKTDELIKNGGNFFKRGEYTHFLIMLTSKKRWMVCIRTSDSSNETAINVINEAIRTFAFDQEDMIINLLLETGVDSFDPILDKINESIFGISI